MGGDGEEVRDSRRSKTILTKVEDSSRAPSEWRQRGAEGGAVRERVTAEDAGLAPPGGRRRRGVAVALEPLKCHACRLSLYFLQS